MDPCQFSDDNLVQGIFGTCCSFRGKVVARELEALGEEHLAARCYEDLTCGQAREFADELGSAADRLEEQHAADKPKPKGAGWNGCWNPQTRECVWASYSTFEEALASIREAARWYEKVGRLGFGVRAWY